MGANLTGDPEVDARRREHWAFVAVRVAYTRLADSPPESPQTYELRRTAHRAKAVWGAALMGIDAL